MPMNRVVLNDMVDPPISIRQWWGRMPTQHAKHQYVDPEDGVAFSAADLTPAEKGYLVKYFLGADGRYSVHFPYRVAEKEDIRVLSHVRATASVPTRRTQSSLTAISVTHEPAGLGLSNFSVPSQAWDRFRELMEKRDWAFEDCSVTEEFFLSKVTVLNSIVKECVDEIIDVRATLRDPSTDWSDESLSSSVLDRLQEVSLTRRTCSVAETLADLTVQVNRQMDCDRVMATVLPAMRAAEQSLDDLRSMDFSRLYREVAHARNKTLGEPSESPLDLGAEIAFLKTQFPALSRMQAAGKSVKIDLSYVTVTLHPDRVEVEGDVTKLASFKSYDESGSPSAGTSKRFSTVLRKRVE